MLVEVKFGIRIGIVGVLDVFRMHYGVVNLKDIKNNFNYSTLYIDVKEPNNGDYEETISTVHSKLGSIYGDVTISTEVNDDGGTDESLFNYENPYSESPMFGYMPMFGHMPKITPPFPNIYDNNSTSEAKEENVNQFIKDDHCSECNSNLDNIFYVKEVKPLNIELVYDAIFYNRLDTLFKLYPIESNLDMYSTIYIIIVYRSNECMYAEFLNKVGKYMPDFIKENAELAKEVLPCIK